MESLTTLRHYIYEKYPSWSQSKFDTILNELKTGEIINVDTSDLDCIQIITREESNKYKVNYISMSGITTTYFNKYNIELLLIPTEGELLLERIFGSPSPTTNRDFYSRPNEMSDSIILSM